MMKSSNALPLPLDYPEITRLPAAANAPVLAPQNLWLCLHLPYFSLDVLGVEDDDKPHVVLHETAGRWLIHTANPLARETGVVSGMSLNAAYALCPDMQIHRRDYLQEQTQLKCLADWAYQYSPLINIVEPQGLLLEVQGSLQLFGGLENLLEKLENAFQQQWSCEIQRAITPTPLGSQLLAEYGMPVIVQHTSDLRSVLSKLPIETLSFEDYKVFQKLHNIGVRNLQDLWRLPRPDLARRFGQNLVKHLDQLLGYSPDIRAQHEVPLCFDESLELPAEIIDKQLLLSSAELLLKRLVLFLQQQDAGITRVFFYLYHYEHPVSHIILGFRQSTRDYAHILDLLQQQLDKVTLPSKVNSLRLNVTEIVPLSGIENTLFPSHILPREEKQSSPEWYTLLEQLQNRLGLDALHYLDVLDDHRPEYAWCYQTDIGNSAGLKTLARPAWLLHTPSALRISNGIPCLKGALRCIQGPERIQSGWWEKQEVCRDYYIARDVDNRRLWIYRDLNQKARWYLHGFFG